MRILFVCADFSVLSQTFVYDRAVGLRDAGHEVYVACIKRSMASERPFDAVLTLRKANRFLRILRQASARFIRAISSKLRFSLAVTTNLEIAYATSLQCMVDELDPDIIHAEFGQMGVLANRIALRAGKRLIVYMHGYDITQLPSDERWRIAYERMWRPGVLIMTPSSYMRNQVIALGAQPKQVVVQHNGISLAKWPYSNVSERFSGAVSFLFVGRLVEKKGPRELLKAFSILREVAPDVIADLVICGSGPLENTLREDALGLHLQDHVKILGGCSSEEIQNWMARAHILVQHSVTAKSGDMEGLPVSLTEGAASGLPIISTRHSGIPELVVDGVNGFLVNEHDVQAMADRMITLARTPALWAPMGQASRKMIEEKFEQSVVLHRYQTLVEKMHTPKTRGISMQENKSTTMNVRAR